MYCPQCGANNEASAGFCNACGLDLGTYAEQWQAPGTQPSGQASPTGQTAPVYPSQQQYPPPAPYRAVPHVPNYLGWAIVVLILCFWPTGIAAVVYASQVDNKLAYGDIPGAMESSRKAKRWCWISFWIAVGGAILAVAVVLLVGLATLTFH
jgi:hypothetical protein